MRLQGQTMTVRYVWVEYVWVICLSVQIEVEVQV